MHSHFPSNCNRIEAYKKGIPIELYENALLLVKQSREISISGQSWWVYLQQRFGS